MSLLLRKTSAENLCLQINTATPVGGLFEGDRENLHPDSRLPWRISPEPFWLSPSQYQFLNDFGNALLQFYRAANLLYQQSVRGIQPSWVHRYLDQGKPEQIVEFGRMNRFKTQLPPVMRPDLLLTDNGFRATEFDSVPGGIGFTAHVSSLYADLGYELIGGRDGLVSGFYEALQSAASTQQPKIAIVVSDEADPYRAEMQWIADRLLENGQSVYCRHPRDIHFDEAGLFILAGDQPVRIDVVYRFFELFDFKNIPKAELLAYFAKKNLVRLTPPLKTYLEEKMCLALLHQPLLRPFWDRELGTGNLDILLKVVPTTWIVDPTPIPPHAIIAGLQIQGQPVADWNQLKKLSKKERVLVVKRSGFSENAQQSRDVLIGHDVPEEIWAAGITRALDLFEESPYILQAFQKSTRVTARYYDFATAKVQPIRARAMLRPYYYVIGDEARLAGIQATICPPDKKLLHGMVDAIVAPCAVGPANI